jgi:tRNA-Thr(GGU) m(6)t(6)A37 methyltransferase TsaA
MNNLVINPVGIIRSSFANKEDAPIQGAFVPAAVGQVELFPDYTAGLKDIGGFSHLILIYHFDRAGEVDLVRPTFLDDEPHGIFATRHPCRPNGIGLTIVRLIEHEGNILTVSGIDVLDGTPLIDIKPYIPRFDAYPEAIPGWFAGKEPRPKPAGRE